MATNKRENNVKNDERIAVLETNTIHINTTLDEIKNALIRIDAKLDSRFDSLNNRLWTLCFWMVGGFASIFAVIAHGFHWI